MQGALAANCCQAVQPAGLQGAVQPVMALQDTPDNAFEVVSACYVHDQAPVLVWPLVDLL